MRIHRIKLTNYQGVESSEVAFAPTGMTIILGPNEVGKSSLIRGFDLLLQFPHDSRHARVQAAQPVHIDSGPEVEVELTTGEYQFVYSKRWNKRAQTTLTIVAPKRESLSGREAHDRVREILGETLDQNLFEALRYIQGSEIGQGAVGGSPTLTGALDRAAAGGSADPDAELTLWQEIERERLRYVTHQTGKPTTEREQLRKSLAEAEEAVATVEREILDLEETGEAYRVAMDSLEANQIAHSVALQDLRRVQQVESEINELETKLATLSAQTETAKLKESEAQRVSDERADLVVAIENGATKLEVLNEARERAELKVSRAQHALDAAEKAVVDAEAAYTDTASRLQLATEDREYYRTIDTDRLYTSRLATLEEARRIEAAATETIEVCHVTAPARKAVEAAWTELSEATVALGVGSPTVTISAIQELEIAVDDAAVELGAGESRSITVTGSSVVSVPELISFKVTGGASGDDLRQQVDDARQKLDGLVERYGLDAADPVGDIIEQLGRRSQAEKELKHVEQLRSGALVDLSEAELIARAAKARSTVTDYPTTRTGETDLPPSVEEAEEALAAARVDAEAAEGVLEDARHTRESSNTALTSAKTADATATEALRGESASLEAARERLGAARNVMSDAVVAERLEGAKTSVAEAEAGRREAEAELLGKNPESTRLQLTNAEALLKRLDEERREIDRQRIRLKTLLEKGGADDLQQRHDEARVRAAEIRRHHEDTERLAAAAVLLYETFLRHRDTARLAYVAPYREQIETLAHLVFGPTVSVEVDPADLSLVSRTLDGRTIPFDSLSTGTKEQLAVLARLACAILVNPDGNDTDSGAPVILDDALGNTDPDRLRALAPAFSAAATRTQVIALASNPNRYGTVGNATIIPIAESR